MKKLILVVAGALLFGCEGLEQQESPGAIEQRQFALEEAANSSGIGSSLHLSGSIDRTNPFFLQLGTNPRSCETCHSAQQGWTINRGRTEALFNLTLGTAPLFNLVDEGNRPDADISTFQARKNTFLKTTVERGLTRFTRSAPAATAEFTLVSVVDPHGWSTTTAYSGFRRPTPTANESKTSSILWTGVPNPDVITQLRGIAVGAARLHEQRDPANPLPTDQAVATGDFMFGVIFAQSFDFRALSLTGGGAKGGPQHLLDQEFYVGINDPAGGDPKGRPFNPKVFNIFDAWASFKTQAADDFKESNVTVQTSTSEGSILRSVARARGSIYRGQELFNARCTGCHSVPNVGGASFVKFFNIGTAEAPNCTTSLLPMLTVENKTTLERKVVCDLGRALASGLWSDIGRFRAPPLRGLAARAPYFHDGQAKDLPAVVNHYNTRLNLNLTSAQKADMAAFLRAL
jgi:cytochrome c peroxidase